MSILNRVIPVIVIVALVGLAGILLFTGPFAPQPPDAPEGPMVDQPELAPEPELRPEPVPEIAAPEPEPVVEPAPDPEPVVEPAPEPPPPQEPVVEPAPEPEPDPEPEPQILEGEAEIIIDRFSFTPNNVTIKIGTKVTWLMQETLPFDADDPGQWHNVHFGPPPGENIREQERLQDGAPGPNIGDVSPNLDNPETWSFTFNEVGTFRFHCHPHPWMTGVIIVVEDPTVAAEEPAGPEIFDGEVEIEINNMGLFSFIQNDITVRVGTTIVWIMGAIGAIDPLYPAEHIIVDDDSSLFESALLRAAGENFSFTFEEVGTIRYHCSIHPFMTGTIRVVA